MFEVKYKDTDGSDCIDEFVDLGGAILYSQQLGQFVTITGDGMEIVGVFGADSVKDGKLPDGHDYTWKKRRI